MRFIPGTPDIPDELIKDVAEGIESTVGRLMAMLPKHAVR